MSRTFVFLVLILGAALLLEVAYHLATVGMLGDAAQYPTARQFAIDAGLAPKPKPKPGPASMANWRAVGYWAASPSMPTVAR